MHVSPRLFSAVLCGEMNCIQPHPESQRFRSFEIQPPSQKPPTLHPSTTPSRSLTSSSIPQPRFYKFRHSSSVPLRYIDIGSPPALNPPFPVFSHIPDSDVAATPSQAEKGLA
ncbi:hypothetical protein L249_3220, partial [Ophiocordyceps polyrhachis-furcata BCC 54312]